MRSKVLSKTLVCVLVISSFSFAQVAAEFDDLGGNRIILEKAKELNPETNIEIVQDRTVLRKMRFEISPEFSGTMGGDDTYSRTQSIGMNVNFHINHRWSVGVKYNHSFNKLTAEGEALVDAAYNDFLQNPENPQAIIPQIDYQKNESLVLLNWCPIYGKLNLLEKRIVQFDVYGLLGAGQVTLNSGAKSTYTAGGGFGFWLTPKISSRLELRYQRYSVEYTTGPKNLDMAVASMQLGWLL
ncbi:MAG: outer membrane beta-barrel domain-containing protein [Bdellovibrionaceae bacterium]|nr:outer membrane beta-barrel domain-containing protein [Pseudobdellovibrionaceae bacterium]